MSKQIGMLWRGPADRDGRWLLRAESFSPTTAENRVLPTTSEFGIEPQAKDA